jgi:ribosomal protein S6--L-glutamate ligase
VRVGWIERVSLPEIGLRAIAAKIDTGARTSALHVSAARPVHPEEGEGDRLVVELMGTRLTRKQRTVELDVEDWVFVRDTSGRRQRRPIIRTVLLIGTRRVTIRLGLTDRGDMRYPLLIGRTALPAGTMVDPHHRFLLAEAAVRRGTRSLRTSTGRRSSAKI